MIKIISILLCVAFSLFRCNGQATIHIHHTYYDVEFDTALGVPLLTSYLQTNRNALSKNKVARKGMGGFKQDPLLDPIYRNANKLTYQKWNRENKDDRKDIGHLVPFEAMTFDSTAALETNYFNTNTCPQSAYFNEHQWAFVEAKVLDSLAIAYDSIIVYTGVLVNINSQSISNVYVPDYYYKLVVQQDGTVLGAWLGANNKDNKDTNPNNIRIELSDLMGIIKRYYPNWETPF